MKRKWFVFKVVLKEKLKAVILSNLGGPAYDFYEKGKKKLSFSNYTRTKTMALLGHSPSVGIMDPSRVFFFNFWHGPIREHPSTPQERAPLKLVTLPGLKVIWLKWLQIELHKVVKIYRRLYGGGQGASLYPPILQTSVKFQTWRF